MTHSIISLTRAPDHGGLAMEVASRPSLLARAIGRRLTVALWHSASGAVWCNPFGQRADATTNRRLQDLYMRHTRRHRHTEPPRHLP